VLERIIRGQSLDLERFGSGADGVRALPDAAALDEYTYLVAGCVGEFWTRLCFRHLKSYSRIDPAELNRLGCAFGKGLQLVNILRDLRADLAMGRCYLPADELSAVGVAPEEARQRAAAARPVNERWITVASQDLESAFRYIEAINPLRLRFACFLPWYLGMRTLALLREQPLETKDRVKVPRCEVRRAMALGIGAAASNGILRRVRRVLVF
jgi:farnesyl-diphosphate farnesyltransferase